MPGVMGVRGGGGWGARLGRLGFWLGFGAAGLLSESATMKWLSGRSRAWACARRQRAQPHTHARTGVVQLEAALGRLVAKPGELGGERGDAVEHDVDVALLISGWGVEGCVGDGVEGGGDARRTRAPHTQHTSTRRAPPPHTPLAPTRAPTRQSAQSRAQRGSLAPATRQTAPARPSGGFFWGSSMCARACWGE